jgi:fumarate hydratase class II
MNAGTSISPIESISRAQTQRSLIHFSIGDDRMPKRVYHAYGYVKARPGANPRTRFTGLALAPRAAAAPLPVKRACDSFVSIDLFDKALHLTHR